MNNDDDDESDDDNDDGNNEPGVWSGFGSVSSPVTIHSPIVHPRLPAALDTTPLLLFIFFLS